MNDVSLFVIISVLIPVLGYAGTYIGGALDDLADPNRLPPQRRIFENDADILLRELSKKMEASLHSASEGDLSAQ